MALTRGGRERVTYVTGRYPAVSHTFVLREVQALRRLGVDVQTVSVWRSNADQLISRHEREEFTSTRVLLGSSISSFLRAHLRAVIACRGRYVAMLLRALQLSVPGLRGRVVGVSWWLQVPVLWNLCRAHGSRHVHAHMDGTAPTLAMLAAGLGGRGGDDPWTWSLTVHGPSEFFDVYRQALAEKVRDADAVIAISDFARSQLMSLVDEQYWDKIEVVHCGVDPEIFVPDARPSTDRHEGPLRILNVARMAPTKGHAILVQAVDRLEREGVPVEVVLAGDGPTKTALESMVLARGLEHRIRFVGPVGQDRIRSLYSWADVFCLPSFAEGVPVVLMEAMAMELPVIATRVAGVAELVESGESGYVLAPGRVDDLVAAIGQLAADPALRQAMGRRGRRTVVEGFSVEENAARLLEILRVRTNVSCVAASIRPATSVVMH